MQKIYQSLGISFDQDSQSKDYVVNQNQPIVDSCLLTKPAAPNEVTTNFLGAQNPIESRKQKQLMRQNEEILNGITDDFDQLTNNVKIKKLKEYIKKRNEENKRNQQNDKKNQSTAYRPTNLGPKPIPRAGEAGAIGTGTPDDQGGTQTQGTLVEGQASQRLIDTNDGNDNAGTQRYSRGAKDEFSHDQNHDHDAEGNFY